MSKTVQMAVYLDEDTYKRFKIKCIEEGNSIKSVIIDFCKDYAGEDNVREDETDSKKIEESKED